MDHPGASGPVTQNQTLGHFGLMIFEQVSFERRRKKLLNLVLTSADPGANIPWAGRGEGHQNRSRATLEGVLGGHIGSVEMPVQAGAATAAAIGRTHRGDSTSRPGCRRGGAGWWGIAGWGCSHCTEGRVQNIQNPERTGHKLTASTAILQMQVHLHPVFSTQQDRKTDSRTERQTAGT